MTVLAALWWAADHYGRLLTAITVVKDIPHMLHQAAPYATPSLVAIGIGLFFGDRVFHRKRSQQIQEVALTPEQLEKECSHLEADKSIVLDQTALATTISSKGTVLSPSDEPNLQPEKPEFITAYEMGDFWTQYRRRNSAIKYTALVIPIRNEPKGIGQIVGIAFGIKARLTWYVNGKEICTSYPSAWLEENLNSVEIGAEAKSLIVATGIAILGTVNDWSAVTHLRDQSAPDGTFYETPAVKLIDLPHATKANKGKMELHLLQVCGGKIKTINTFTYDWLWKPDSEGGETQRPYIAPRKK